jgi:hypothetical protein
MLELIKPYLLWIKIGVCLLVIVAICYEEYRFYHYAYQVGYDAADLKHIQADNKALEEALEKTKQLQLKVKEAENAARIREQTISNLVGAVDSLNRRLLDHANGLQGQLTSASTEALVNAAATLNTLFTECRGKLQELGRKADGHTNDVRKFEESWPVN